MLMRARWILSGMALTLGSATVTAACTVNIPPPARIEFGKSQGTIEGVAVVSVKSAQYIAEKDADMHPWRAIAMITETHEGANLPSVIQFERGWGSSACEWNTPARPNAGDRWVIYFWKNRAGAYRPWLAMPEHEAEEFDPAFAKRRQN